MANALTATTDGSTGDNDNINGTSKDDVITADAGNDTVNAGAGNDLVDGGTGNDKLYGGDGNDLLLGGTVTVNPNGTLNYTANANYNGPDTITYTLTDNGIASPRYRFSKLNLNKN